MARETKAEFAARVAKDNADAAAAKFGAKHTDPLTGAVYTLVGREDGQIDGWNLYTVHHSTIIPGGANVNWASHAVARAFTDNK